MKLQIGERNGKVQKQEGPWQLRANLSAGLWAYKTMRLDRLGITFSICFILDSSCIVLNPE